MNGESASVDNTDLLKVFKTKRRNLKAALTRFHNYVTEFNASSEIGELKGRLAKAEFLLDEFEKAQEQIDCLEYSDDSAQQCEEFENSFFKITAKARKIIENCQAASSSNNYIAQNLSSDPLIKLPTMHLPEFDGSYDKWMGFYDIFDALVNKNHALTAVQRFYYLKSALKGEAAHLLNSLEVNDSNYDIAWNLLKERYENKKLIISTHVKAIFELPLVIKDSHKSLRSLIDNFNKHLRSLTNLKLPTDKWDILLIYVLTNKLDNISKHEWEKVSVNKVELPSLGELLKFLVERCHILENMSSDNFQTQTLHKRSSSSSHLATNSSNTGNCHYCKKDHLLFRCSEFLKLSVQNRWKEIKKLKLCANCFRANHFNNECKASCCKKCNKNHNTILHDNGYEQRAGVNIKGNIASSKPETNEIQQSQAQSHLVTIKNDTENLITAHSVENNTYVILATAQINILDAKGNHIRCRALLDSGSQSNFITGELFNKLGLRGTKINMPVSGINKTTTQLTRQVTTQISSLYNEFKRNLSFLILKDITGNVPSTNLDVSNVKIPNGINLADQEFNISNKIDILLGAEIFWSLLCIGQIRVNNGNAILQKTRLGWLFAGSVVQAKQKITVLHSTIQDVQNQLEKFWRIEDCEGRRDLTNEELYCENHFISNFKRDCTGRFEVRLPMREEHFDFKNSLENAKRRFFSLEKRFSRDSEFKKAYQTFIYEYESLGHMSEVKPAIENNDDNSIFYLPHHGVIKNSSTTTKLRVVFDASCKSTSGYSLNQKLCVGPHIQDDLFSIIIRFRKHTIIYTADIAKMYRQINIANDQRDLQRIVWRNSDSEPLRHYRLNTITYGTAPASFLAMRCLQQLGNENMHKLPKASNAIINDFYMDDLITGTDTMEEAIKTKNDIQSILEGAGFQLRKWSSNRKSIFRHSDVKRDADRYYIADDKETKTLGLMWDTHEDRIGYSFLDNNTENKITKRTILSSTAKMYDPLGLLGPITIKIKIMLQHLWKERLDWDESVPLHIYTEWKRILVKLKDIEGLRLPRQVTIANYAKLELHGFCDASEVAYGCCVYIRSMDKKGNIECNLLCAKSRVAPLKTITVPRLELCGAVLLTNLMHKISNSFTAKFERVCYWCDSTIVLSWIKSESTAFQVFVANRINEIQRFSDSAQWYHVRSSDNPADMISRGLSPEMLVKNLFWWEGPTWLKDNTYKLQTSPQMKELPETKKNNYKTLSFIGVSLDSEFDLFQKYSSLLKLQKVLAYSLRFIKNASTHKSNKITGKLTVGEINNAMQKLILIAQNQFFKSDIDSIKATKRLTSNSNILSLNPFIDKEGILRVGGRLCKSLLSVEHKYPIILPSKGTLTNLIIDYEHKRNLHIGVEGTLAMIRTKFWPIHGRSTIRKVIHKCVTCARFRLNKDVPFMGDLPLERVHPSRPFLHSAVDYAGPFHIKDGKTRNRKIVKAYLCLFVCFATKAVHLEVASDLSTSSFLNAFKRFVGRRGICKSIYSDNGTNFVGANRELKNIIKLLSASEFSDYFRQNSIDWKFIPSRSPHFGGFYEAAIKAAKSIMKRVIGNAHLTFEQLTTVFVQIESVLNSRPITPISNDPNDLLALTPGHFLIGDVLNCIPQESEIHTPENRLNHYTRLNQMFQQFWKRWTGEYTHTLQSRVKWRKQQPQIKIGAMVLLKGESTPPLLWPLGRVVELHPGADSTVRVVTVKTGNGLVKRAVVKLCILPIDI